MHISPKAIGYTVLVAVTAAFVAWVKYSILTGFAFGIVLAAAALFCAGWRFHTGTWPGNDVQQRKHS